jgi:hypothetical protein
MKPNVDLDYTESYLIELMNDERFLAAADSYSKDLIPFGVAKSLAIGSRPMFGGKTSPLGFAQALHKAAEIILKDSSVIPEGLHDRYPEIYQHHQSDKTKGVLESMSFSELNKPSEKRRILRLYRQSWNQDDYDDLVNDDKNLAYIDAYAKGVRSNHETVDLILDSKTDVFNNLDPLVMHALVLEVARHLRSGTKKISEDTIKKYETLYVKN